MANRVLRDHCEHGRYERHGESTSRVVRNDKDELITETDTSWCPGGREVTGIECQAIRSEPVEGGYGISLLAKQPLDSLTMHGELLLVAVIGDDDDND